MQPTKEKVKAVGDLIERECHRVIIN